MQEDFGNEVMLLQYHAMKLGVNLGCSPKCHLGLVLNIRGHWPS